MVNVSNKLPMVNTLISQTIIQNANVLRFDIFNVSSESDVFDFIAFLDFMLETSIYHTRSKWKWKNAKCMADKISAV